MPSPSDVAPLSAFSGAANVTPTQAAADAAASQRRAELARQARAKRAAA